MPGTVPSDTVVSRNKWPQSEGDYINKLHNVQNCVCGKCCEETFSREVL